MARPAAVPAVVHHPGVHPGETRGMAPGAAWPVAPAFGPALVLSGGSDVGAFGARGGAEAHFLAAADAYRIALRRR